MDKYEAHQILDNVIHGIPQPKQQVTIALTLTGDLRPAGRTLRETRNESCYVRSRQIYGETAYERIFGDVQDARRRRESED